MAATIKDFQNGVTNQVQDVDINGLKNENNNAIEGSGQNLDIGDNFQTEKAIAVYAAKGDFYQEAVGSAADVYVLEKTGEQQQIFAYQDGMRIRFKVVNANTGASTVNINSLGVKTIEFGGVALIAGDLLVGEIVSLRFDLSADTFNLIKAIDAPIVASAYLNYNSTTSTILKSKGISGVVKNGTGDITITFDDPFPDANYQVHGNSVDLVGIIGSRFIGIGVKLAANINIFSRNDSGTAVDSPDINVAFWAG